MSGTSEARVASQRTRGYTNSAGTSDANEHAASQMMSAGQLLSSPQTRHLPCLLTGYDKYVRGKVLGRGSFGQVREGMLTRAYIWPAPSLYAPVFALCPACAGSAGDKQD